jgi:cytochrome c peroxidase
MRQRLFIAFILIVSSSFLSSSYKSKNYNHLVINKLHRLETVLKYLKKNPKITKVTNAQLRLSVHSVAWIFPKYCTVTEIEAINNAKYWVINDEMVQLNYPEAGILQLIEKRVEDKQHDTKHIIDLVDKLIHFTQKLTKQIIANPLQNDELYPLFYLFLQEQYLLHLTGYYHAQTSDILPEVKAQLTNLLEFIPDKSLQEKIIYLKNAIARNTFENLDRWQIYNQFYLPILRDLQQHFPQNLPKYIHNQVGQNLFESNLFSENFLNTSFYAKKPQNTDSQLIDLGEILFFDPLLSQNNKRACASCHKPQKAFSDGRQTSLGFNISEKLTRNSPSLLNSIYNQYFSHDLAKKSLEEQILFVVHNPKEFNSRLDESIKKIAKIPEYQERFKKSFPEKPTVDSTNILRAIVAYMGTLKSFDSEFDLMMSKHKKGDTQIQKGYNLFMGKGGCGSCHFAPLFNGLKPPFFSKNEFHKIMSPQTNTLYSDLGIAQNGNDKYRDKRYEYFFKTPTLRNLKHTEPLMHDGTIIGIKEAIALHTKTKKNQPNSYYPSTKLTDEEINDIVIFLENLNTEFPLKKFPEPLTLPKFTHGEDTTLNKRRIGGVY